MSSLIILINLILACSRVLSDRVDVDPKCSPFEYEERTLMKTIRLEHEMELSNKKADDNDKLMREEIESLKLQLEHNEKAIELVKADQEVWKQKLEGKLLY